MVASRWSMLILSSAIAGCGGNFTMPPIDWGPLSCHPRDEAIVAEPGRAVVAVGATVEFSVSSGAQQYSWQRCAPSGVCAEMPDVTGPSYTWAGLNLADDGSRIEVTSYDCDTTGRASVRVEVLPGPGWVFEDGEFFAGDWETQVFDEAGGPIQVVVARPTAGGNPGAYLDVSYELPPKTYARVFHGASQATYDPTTQGAIYVVAFAAQSPSGVGWSGVYLRDLQPAFRQGGRLYAVTWPLLYSPTSAPWTTAFSRTSYDIWRFQYVAGPPCGTGETCPDFSTHGSPIKFGFMATMSSDENAGHVRAAVDNWRVTVWRR